MRKLLLSIACLAISVSGFAQFGVKGGLNYNSNGKYKEIVDAGENILKDKGDAKVGYHLGVYYQMDLTKVYLRPELVYTRTKSDYLSNSYNVSKIDLPILLGVEVLGPLSLFAGPSFQYVLDNDLENNTLSDVKNDISVGLNVGAALKLGNIGLDVRYERGFTNNEASLIGSNLGNIDSRPSQLIFSLSIRLSDKKRI